MSIGESKADKEDGCGRNVENYVKDHVTMITRPPGAPISSIITL
jgi:hypothetical protein